MLWASHAFADTIPFLGENLPVDSLSRVDEEQVAVELKSEAIIAKKGDAGRRLAFMYAARLDLARQIPWSGFVQIVARAAAGEDLE
jgi:hypothetical protein